MPLTCYTCQSGNSVCYTRQENIAGFTMKRNAENEANLQAGSGELGFTQMPSVLDVPTNVQEDAEHTESEEDTGPEVYQLLAQLDLAREVLRMEVLQELTIIDDDDYHSTEQRLLSTPPQQLTKQDLGLLLQCIQCRTLTLLDASYLPSLENATKTILLQLVLVAVPIESLHAFSLFELERYTSFYIDACDLFRPDLNPNLIHRFAEIVCRHYFLIDGSQYFGPPVITPDDVRAILEVVPISEYPPDLEAECSVCYVKWEDATASKAPCKHIYCENCWIEWLTRPDSQSCPTCRTSFARELPRTAPTRPSGRPSILGVGPEPPPPSDDELSNGEWNYQRPDPRF